jgi:hypothetical protein
MEKWSYSLFCSFIGAPKKGNLIRKEQASNLPATHCLLNVPSHSQNPQPCPRDNHSCLIIKESVSLRPFARIHQLANRTNPPPNHSPHHSVSRRLRLRLLPSPLPSSLKLPAIPLKKFPAETRPDSNSCNLSAKSSPPKDSCFRLPCSSNLLGNSTVPLSESES